MTTAVTELKGVGPKLAARLTRLGVASVADLALLLPARYQDRTRVVAIAALTPGQEALIEGDIVATELRGGRQRRMLLCRLRDASGEIDLRFFHAGSGRRGGFSDGSRLRCYGEVRQTAAGPEMSHPDYQHLDPAAPPPAPQLTPVYPATEGLSQAALRRLLEQTLRFDDDALNLHDHLPATLRERLALPALGDAARWLHRPEPGAAAELAGGRHPAQRRLAFEELLAQQLGLRRLRQRRRADPAPRLDGETAAALRQRFIDVLPFPLTDAQRRVAADVMSDLAQPQPMLRLVQGDVGSGKTVIAALAALTAIGSGKQAALMAPTELLSEQHYRTLSGWLEPLGVTVAWLTGRLKTAARRAALQAIENGGARLVVGTHALFQQAVEFDDLGVVIIDEQHRFGVHQRLALRAKGARPHQLVMTATPIPRTLAMSAYADLDTSIIDELPPGRTPVTTVTVADARRAEVVARIGKVCAEGRQAYWVCTLVEESEVLQAQDAEQTAQALTAALPALRIGLIHGRLSGEQKEQVMTAFSRAELDLLVATTVIEVGVDVPNASLMIIENPERLGLAQLHQLRGRVGRGSVASHCVLLYRAPLSRAAKAKLAALRDSNDGFLIAERDLELRGPGEVLGTRQTGDLQFRIADLGRDADLLPTVRSTADELLAAHPDSADAIADRWVGGDQAYGEV